LKQGQAGSQPESWLLIFPGMMRILLSFFLICFLFTGCAAQTRWQYGGYLLPALSRQHTLENGDKFPLWEYPRTGFSYGAGFSLYRKAGRSLWLQTGAGLARRQFVSFSELTMSNPGNGRLVADTLRTVNSYTDLEVPLLVQLRRGKANLKWTSAAGLVLGFTARQSQRITGYYGQYPDQHLRRGIPGLDHVSFWLSTGGLYPLTCRLLLLIEPCYLLNFTDLVRPNALFYDKPHRSLGIRSSLLFSVE
jgi:hypothetical protein